MQIYDVSTGMGNGLKTEGLSGRPTRTKLAYKLQEIDHVEKGVHFYLSIF